jgi:hypothetical protein
MTGRNSRRTRSGRRVVSSAPKRYQILVFAEGAKTEECYINHWGRRYREHVIVKIAPHRGTAPMTLVERAIAQRRQDLREARRGQKGQGEAYDEYWCIFDVDEHPQLTEAVAQAVSNGIKVALSSPCLEVWFLLHFEPWTANLDRRDAQRRAKAHLSCREKLLPPEALELLEKRYEIAKQHAQVLDQKHYGDGSAQPWNPCSNVWELVDTIKKAGAIPGTGVPHSCWHLR